MQNSSRSNAITGIKGISALLIATTWHYQHLAGPAHPLWRVLSDAYQSAWALVLVFFMLSGFGMTLGYEQKILSEKISFKEYITKRAVKIFPVLWITLIATTILEFTHLKIADTTFVYSNFDAPHFFMNIFGIQNGVLGEDFSFNAPSWCVSITLVMYLLFYPVVYLMRKNRKAFPWVYLGLSVFGFVILATGKSYPLWNNQMGQGICAFFLGAFLVYVVGALNKLQNKPVKYIISLAFLILAVMPIVVARLRGYGDWNTICYSTLWCVAPFGLLAVSQIKPLNILAGNPLFVWLGKISIYIYLWHFPVQCVIKILNDTTSLSLDYATKAGWFTVTGSILLVSAAAYYVDGCLTKRFGKLYGYLISAGIAIIACGILWVVS